MKNYSWLISGGSISPTTTLIPPPPQRVRGASKSGENISHLAGKGEQHLVSIRPGGSRFSVILSSLERRCLRPTFLEDSNGPVTSAFLDPDKTEQASHSDCGELQRGPIWQLCIPRIPSKKLGLPTYDSRELYLGIVHRLNPAATQLVPSPNTLLAPVA